MTIEDLENLPDGIIIPKTKSNRQLAEEMYADMYAIILDRQDAKDCARLQAQRLGRETQNILWKNIEEEINNI
jgi:hypothetical protein